MNDFPDLKREILIGEQTLILRQEGYVELAVDRCIKDIEGFKSIIRLRKYDQTKLQEKIEELEKQIEIEQQKIDDICDQKNNLEGFLETFSNYKSLVEEQIDKEANSAL